MRISKVQFPTVLVLSQDANPAVMAEPIDHIASCTDKATGGMEHGKLAVAGYLIALKLPDC